MVLTPYDDKPGTWAYVYSQVWNGFKDTIDKIAEEENMPNRYFFRETFIDYLYERHKLEIENGNSSTSPTA